MGIEDKETKTWEETFQFEHQNLAVKIFSDICCNGCSCKIDKDHKPE